MDIRLRPLREDEFDRFLRTQRAEYVRSLVDEAGLSAEQAEEKSRADLGSLFPDGAQQEHHRISVVENAASGEPVGRVFWAPRGAGRAYVYDLFVEQGARGQGVGRRTLELVEAEARAEGLSGIDLNVWGRNDAARALYRTAGYYERAVAMSKELE